MCAYGGVVRQPGRKAFSTVRGTRTGSRPFARRLRRRAARAARRRLGASRGRLSWVRLGTARNSPWLRRGALAVVLLAVTFGPYASQDGPVALQSTACRSDCRAGEQNMVRWTQALPGSWNVLPGLGGTVPAAGLAYAAAGNGLVAIGAGMTVYAYSAATGKSLWQAPLTGFPAGARIVSVRTWPGEVTAGVAYQSQRTEVVLARSTGSQTGQYPSAPFGGAVAGSTKYTVIVGRTDVTSYDNATGHVRWRRPTSSVGEGWQVDGRYLYVAESKGGYLGSTPVTALRRIDTGTGAEQEILPADPAGDAALEGISAFSGRLVSAFDGVVLFSAAAGVTAYSGSSGVRLWFTPDAVPEGIDPQQGRFYLTRGSTLVAVSPLTGRIRASIPSGGVYAVRDGIALGLDPGAEGDAWGYYLAGQRVTMTASGLGWPHFFVDLSGIGGSADLGSDLVVIAACAQAGQASTAQPTRTASTGSASPGGSASPASSASSDPASSTTASSTPTASASSSTSASPTTSASASPSASTSPTAPVTQACSRPELVALGL
jgi:hypothetical protein